MLTRVRRLYRRIMSSNAGPRSSQMDTPKVPTMGEGTIAHPSVQFYVPEEIKIGEYVYIGPRVQVFGGGGVHLADHCIIGPEVAILSESHNHTSSDVIPYDDIVYLDAVQIGQCCWIGFRAIVLPGVTLGEGCIVGAGAVVTKSCGAGSIVCGNPARRVGRRDLAAYYACARSGRYYFKLKSHGNLAPKRVLRASDASSGKPL